MALSLVLALTLVLALVRNIIIFSKVRVLVLNQPIIQLLLLLLLLLLVLLRCPSHRAEYYYDAHLTKLSIMARNGGSAARWSSKWSWP